MIARMLEQGWPKPIQDSLTPFKGDPELGGRTAQFNRVIGIINELRETRDFSRIFNYQSATILSGIVERGQAGGTLLRTDEIDYTSQLSSYFAGLVRKGLIETTEAVRFLSPAAVENVTASPGTTASWLTIVTYGHVYDALSGEAPIRKKLIGALEEVIDKSQEAPTLKDDLAHLAKLPAA